MIPRPMTRLPAALVCLLCACSGSVRPEPTVAPVVARPAAARPAAAQPAASRPVPPRPVLSTRTRKMRVTACSPNDPQDLAYYAKYGYEGAPYGIAADLRRIPRGTMLRVPGYLKRLAPGAFWPVDSAGGSIIRQSSADGVLHIDVKFRTYASARQWGSRWLKVEVVDADDYAAWVKANAEWEIEYGRPSDDRPAGLSQAPADARPQPTGPLSLLSQAARSAPTGLLPGRVRD